jgi:WD40 repeat protein/tetratricopeptide (TPR) repeat protein
MAEEQTPTTAGVGATSAEPTVAPVSPPGYELIDEIGHGGMGVVYRARDVGLDRDVAVKLLSERYPAGSPAVQRFLSEARITGQLQHPGIPAVHQVGTLPDGRPFLAMKLIRGTTLADILQHRTDPAAERGRLLAIFEAICQAVGYAHAHRVIHRDLKPANVMVGRFGEVQVMDWGLAKVLGQEAPASVEALGAETTRAWTEVSPPPETGSHTQAGSLVGTPAYIAPEQAAGELDKVDERADVFGLGAVLAVILTGQPPYVAESFESLRVQAVRGKLEDCFARLDASGAEPELVALCKQCLAFEPADRPADADAVAQAVAGLRAEADERARRAELERVRVEGEQATAQARSAERRKRRRLVLGAAAVLAVAAIGGLMAVLAVQREANADQAAKNRELEVANKEANDAHQQALLERDRSRQVSSDLALDKGIALAEAGHADRGLLWMLEALKTAPEDAESFKRMIRWNLGAWLGQVHKPLRSIDVGVQYFWCALSPDGKSFATANTFGEASKSMAIVLWDTASGRKVATFSGAVGPCAFRPDGKALIAYADQSRMVAIELAIGRVLWTTPPLPGKGHWESGIDFSADGSTVLALRRDGEDRLSCRLDVLTGRERGEPMRGRGWMAVAPDGRLAASGRTENGEAYIDLVDLPSGRRTASWPARAPALSGLVFSPDGKSLFVSSREGNRKKDYSLCGRIWAVGTGGAASPLMARTRFGVFTPSADRLVTLTEDLLLVRDLTGRVRGSGLPSAFWRVDSPGGRIMLGRTSDHTACLWEISAEAEPVPDKQASLTASTPSPLWEGRNVFRADLRADGQIAVSQSVDAAGREQVRLSDPATGRPIGVPARQHAGWFVLSFAFSPDGRCFATGSDPREAPRNAGGTAAMGELRLWETSTGRLLFPPILQANYVSAIAFHPDGKLVATGDYSGLVRTWDVSTGREIGRPLPQGEIVLALSFSPDGKVLAVGLARDRTRNPGTRLWDATTRQRIGELLPSTDNITRIVFRPDGRALLAGTNGWTRLWDTIQGQALTEPFMDEEAGGFRHDGREFLTVGGDGTVKLRDATTGEVRGRFLISSSRANCAVFRGDDGLVAAGFEDGAVRLFDPATNQPVGPPRSLRHAVARVAFTSDGRSVAAVDEAGESRTWPIPEPLDGNLDDLTLRIEARTGLRMETGLALARLSSAAWQERLEQLGRLDPQAAGPDTDPAWHAPMIREAEQDGNAFAAIWHLDRLIAAQADDWFLYARRGRSWSLSDQFDKAEVDFQKAEQLSSPDQVRDFQTQCVLDCTKANRWATALWYLDRLIVARPKDWSLHLDRAEVYGKLGREADRQSELARVYELGADEGVVIPRAEELGKAGRWSEAASLLAGCGRRGPLSHQLAQAWAIACLHAKDDAGYREACAAILAWQGADPTVVWNALSAASVFALGAKGLDDYRVPIAWMEGRLSAVPAPSPVARHLFSNAFGGLLLRAGRLDEAIARIYEGIAAAKDVELPTDWTYLALVEARKGKLVEARKMLDRLRDWRPEPSTTFWDLQEVTLLRSEAEALVGSDKEEPKK